MLLVLLLNPIAIFQYKYGLKGDYYQLRVKPKDESKLETILSKLGSDVRSRSVKNGQVIATIISSHQRNAILRAGLKKAKIGYDLELSDD